MVWPFVSKEEEEKKKNASEQNNVKAIIFKSGQNQSKWINSHSLVSVTHVFFFIFLTFKFIYS